MYSNHFGLRENPFEPVSPSPFIYPSHEIDEAVAHFLFAWENRDGFFLLIGEVGTGKSTVIHEISKRLPPDVPLAILRHTTLSSRELVEAIALRFGIEIPRGISKPKLLARIEAFLTEKLEEGRLAVLIVDEAHLLEDSVLEEVRLLSNLQKDDRMLLQICLAGQPELLARLRQRRLRPLRQRIQVRYTLAPLSREETRNYLIHRLRAAGSKRSKEIFSRDASDAVFRLSGGIPREINAIANQAMIEAYLDDARVVTAAHVLSVPKNFGFEGVQVPAEAASGERSEPASARKPEKAARETPRARPEPPRDAEHLDILLTPSSPPRRRWPAGAFGIAAVAVLLLAGMLYWTGVPPRAGALVRAEETLSAAKDLVAGMTAGSAQPPAASPRPGSTVAPVPEPDPEANELPEPPAEGDDLLEPEGNAETKERTDRREAVSEAAPQKAAEPEAPPPAAPPRSRSTATPPETIRRQGTPQRSEQPAPAPPSSSAPVRAAAPVDRERSSAGDRLDLGVSLARKGLLEEAAIAFREAAELDPDYAQAHYNLGAALLESGRTAEAAEALRRATELEPEDAVAHRMLGVALQRADRSEEAIDALGKAVEFDPRDRLAHHHLGIALREAGRNTEAIQAFQRTVALGPDDPLAHQHLGVALRQNGNLEEAVAAFERSISLRSDDPLAYQNLGFALQSLHRTEEAIAAFDKAIQLDPASALAHYSRGVALKQLGRNEEAARALEEARRLGYSPP